MIEKSFSVRIHETYPLKDVARAHTVSVAALETWNAAERGLLGYRKSEDDGQTPAQALKSIVDHSIIRFSHSERLAFHVSSTCYCVCR